MSTNRDPIPPAGRPYGECGHAYRCEDCTATCTTGTEFATMEDFIADLDRISNACLVDELLEACRTAEHVMQQLQDVENLFQESWNVNLALTKLRAAIAKAQGCNQEN